MNDVERLWKFGKIYKAIYEEGRKTREWLDKHPGHTIILTKKKSEEEEYGTDDHDQH